MQLSSLSALFLGFGSSLFLFGCSSSEGPQEPFFPGGDPPPSDRVSKAPGRQKGENRTAEAGTGFSPVFDTDIEDDIVDGDGFEPEERVLNNVQYHLGMVQSAAISVRDNANAADGLALDAMGEISKASVHQETAAACVAVAIELRNGRTTRTEFEKVASFWKKESEKIPATYKKIAMLEGDMKRSTFFVDGVTVDEQLSGVQGKLFRCIQRVRMEDRGASGELRAIRLHEALRGFERVADKLEIISSSMHEVLEGVDMTKKWIESVHRKGAPRYL